MGSALELNWDRPNLLTLVRCQRRDQFFPLVAWWLSPFCLLFFAFFSFFVVPLFLFTPRLLCLPSGSVSSYPRVFRTTGRGRWSHGSTATRWFPRGAQTGVRGSTGFGPAVVAEVRPTGLADRDGDGDEAIGRSPTHSGFPSRQNSRTSLFLSLQAERRQAFEDRRAEWRSKSNQNQNSAMQCRRRAQRCNGRAVAGGPSAH